MTNAEMFQKLIDEVDEHIGVACDELSSSVGLFHLLAAAIDWCDAQTPPVDFDLTLEEVRQHFSEEQERN